MFVYCWLGIFIVCLCIQAGILMPFMNVYVICLYYNVLCQLYKKCLPVIFHECRVTYQVKFHDHSIAYHVHWPVWPAGFLTCLKTLSADIMVSAWM